MNKREFLFLYDVKDCIPNGDPFTGEQRYDEDTQKALVSDVRLKRYIRDFIDDNQEDESWLDKEKDKIFYSDKNGKKRTGARASELSPKADEENKNLKELKSKCIDVRLFGTVIAKDKNKNDEYNVQATGSVQFKMFNRTINKVYLPTTQNTSVMKSSEGNEQGAMATYSYLPYGLFCCVGYFNPTTGKENGVSEDDLEKMKIALWNGINTKNTRSKTGQQSRLFIEIIYNDDYYKIPDIEYSISLNNEKEFKYRCFDDVKNDLDFSKLEKFLNDSADLIKEIRVYIDSFSFEKDFLKIDDKLKGKIKYLTIQGKEKKELK